MNGWGPKRFGMSLETREIKLFFAGYPGILLGYPGGARKVREEKSLCSIFVPYKGVMQPHATLRRVLRRFFKGSAFLEGFLEGAL